MKPHESWCNGEPCARGQKFSYLQCLYFNHEQKESYEIAGTMWLQCDTRTFLQGLNVFQLDHVFQYSQCGHIVNKGRNFVNENEEDANEGTQAGKTTMNAGDFDYLTWTGSET